MDSENIVPSGKLILQSALEIKIKRVPDLVKRLSAVGSGLWISAFADMTRLEEFGDEKVKI